MAWNDRVKELAYTSPSGTRQTADYEDVSKSIEKKTAGFTFPDADGTYVQDNGRSGNKYPLKWIFWGDDCDTEADSFEALLLERGTGKLEHPIYGTRDVVPFGAITREDKLKTAANQAVLTVTFWETIGLAYPTGAEDPASEVLTSVDEYNTAMSEEFAESISVATELERVALKNQVLALVDSVKSGLQTIAEVQESVEKEFNAIVDSINNGIDVLVDAPLALAFQITQLIQAPARAFASIKDRLNAYKNLADSLISGDGAGVSTNNELRTNDLFASSYVTGSIVSTVNNQFASKTEAQEAASEVLTQFADVVVWRDDNFETIGEIDTGEAYQKLQEATAITAGFLVEISFSLDQERIITLDRNRTIIDLSAELYGSIAEEKLCLLICANDLTGSEILELPKGREIKYYIS